MTLAGKVWEGSQLTRPMMRVCGTDISGGQPVEAESWQTYEPGMATATLGEWREQTMHEIGQIWLGHWEAIDMRQARKAAAAKQAE